MPIQSARATSGLLAPSLLSGVATGIELTLAVCGAWLSLALGLAVTAIVADGGAHAGLGIAAGIATVAVASLVPARAFRSASAVLEDRSRATGAFRQGLLLALFGTVVLLWIGTLGFVNIASGVFTAPAAVPGRLTGGVLLACAIATVACAAAFFVMWRRQAFVATE